MKAMLWRGVSRGRPIPALREREVEESPMVVVEPAALWWQEFERRTEMRSDFKVTTMRWRKDKEKDIIGRE